MKIAVIGAGASGIIAALKASQQHHVILIDKNDKCGKKLLVTGNGRCNYWHDNITKDFYHTDNYDALNNILASRNETYKFLLSLGIYPRIKDGYYYPYANTAYSIREIFANELKKQDIEFKNNFEVKKIEKTNNGFEIVSDNEIIHCNKVIIATGSKAMPKSGSDGFGYQIANSYNIKVNKVLPALVSLNVKESFLKEWSGIRCDASISLLVDNQIIRQETGELQLTDNGVSGICIFNLSSDAIRALEDNKKVKLSINFAPFTNDFYHFFEERSLSIKNQSIKELCESLFNYKLWIIFLHKCNINANAYWQSLTEKEKNSFISIITAFSVEISGYGSFEKAQVCTGGVSLNEIDYKTMEVKKVSGMYLTGELLDVDGICGGYNLAFAFISGYIAGKSV